MKRGMPELDVANGQRSTGMVGDVKVDNSTGGYDGKRRRRNRSSKA